MKFRVDRDDFADAVAWTARALPARPAMPVLAGMRVEAFGEGGGLRLSGFDYEVSSRARIGADVEDTGSVLVSGRLLAEIAKNLPNAPVELSVDGARALLTCGSARFTLLTLPLEDYPTLPDMPDSAGSVPAEPFAAAVRQVTPAASRDDTLPMLTGVHMSFTGDTITLATTDRYRIAVRRLWWHSEHPEIDASALVPARTLHDFVRSLTAGKDVGVALTSLAGGAGASRGDGMIGFDTGARRTTSRLIDSDYIDYAKRFPSESFAHAEVPVAPLTEAVKRVALVADRSTPLRLSFTEREVVLEAGSGDDAQAVEALDVVYKGDPMRVAFAPGYFLDGLGGVASETARLDFTLPTKPVVISEPPDQEGAEPDFRYLVMPLRVS